MSINHNHEIETALSIPDRLQRALHVVGLWTERLKSEGIRPIIVGGTAVEFYTFGAYMTYDIDLVCANRHEALVQLKALGFEQSPSPRHWYHEKLAMVIEIPDDQLAGSVERIARVEVGPYSAYVIGIEDLVLDRLRAYVHWASPQDGEWAKRLLSLHQQAIDWPYLVEMASAEDGLYAALRKFDPRKPT